MLISSLGMFAGETIERRPRGLVFEPLRPVPKLPKEARSCVRARRVTFQVPA